ncbi:MULTISPECIES: hypothetical protein [unclassified Pseudomonas]|uniref:hypothetical protein n=1 Tax=unclassified Pseudomonas TaxID=196821 RepID=UPI0013145E7C|nr:MULTISPECIES: hypothetical protein [unclassified Pseudomonas]
MLRTDLSSRLVRRIRATPGSDQKGAPVALAVTAAGPGRGRTRRLFVELIG